MANKRHKPEEIVTKLRQVEVLVGQGMRELGIQVGFPVKTPIGRMKIPVSCRYRTPLTHLFPNLFQIPPISTKKPYKEVQVGFSGM